MAHFSPPPHLFEKAQELAQANPQLEGHVFATSGTTSAPKWVVHSKESLDWCARAVNERFHCTSKDIWGLALPEFHVGGFCLTHRAQLAEGQLTRFDSKWNAEAFQQWLAVEKVTVTSLVPTQLFDLIKLAKQAPPQLRLALIGGERLNEFVWQKALELGWPLVVSYGMTETAGLVAASKLGQRDLHPLSGWNLANTPDGLLTISGPGLFKGYLTSDGMQTIEQPFVTKDLVSLTEGKLTFLGRSDDQVKILGELVDLAALRQSLSAIAQDVPATVLSYPDERRGASLCAVFESLPSQELSTLLAAWNGTLPPFSRCKDFAFIETWPRTALGKTDLQALSTQVANERDSLLPDFQSPA